MNGPMWPMPPGATPMPYGPMPMHPMMGQGWEQMWQGMWQIPLVAAVIALSLVTVALALAVFGLAVAVKRDRGGAGKPA
jgi:hypothetical protein